MNPSPSFEAGLVAIGAIYPFHESVNLIPIIENNSISKWNSNFERVQDVKLSRRWAYNSDLQYEDFAKLYGQKIHLDSLRLSTGRLLYKLIANTTLCVYPYGFSSIIFWIDFPKDELFSVPELIELAALARGTSERIIKGKNAVEARVIMKSAQFPNLFELNKHVYKQSFPSSFKMSQDSIFAHFSHPMIYVGNLQGCDSSADISSSFATELTALSHLWLDSQKMIKAQEIQKVLDMDYHPFTYGISISSMNCTIEIHPEKQVLDIAALEGISVIEHHWRERSQLTSSIEISILQYFVFRWFNMKLSELLKEETLKPIDLVNPLKIPSLIQRIIKLTSLRENFIQAIAQFRNSYLKHRNYIQFVSDIFAVQLNINFLEEEVRFKLDSITKNIELSYSTLTTMFVIFLSIVATILAIIQTIAACIQTFAALNK